MKFTVTHQLSLDLAAPPRLVTHVLLTPPATPQQKIEHWSIDMPGFAQAAPFRDGFGNRAHLVTQVKPGDTLAVTATGTVETTDRAGVLGRLDHDPPPGVYLRRTALTPPDAELIEGISNAGGRIAVMHELMGRVHEADAASRTQEGEAQSQSQSAGPRDVAALAHRFIAGARSLDIPARYVTGYLFDEGAASLHVWAEAWDDGLGWIGFDPLLNLCPTDTHIRLAAGLDAAATVPLRLVPAETGMTQSVEIVEG